MLSHKCYNFNNMESKSQKILNGILTTRRIAGAYIFTGNNEKQKLDSAKYFAKALNCTTNIDSCIECESCIKAEKSIHPDITIIEKDKNSIKIEQIRSLKTSTRFGPSEGKWQVVIINNADTMSTEAANSFLKLLEEPAPNVVFILIANREGNLPKTILSRCQKILFEESTLEKPSDESHAIFNRINDRSLDFIDMSQVLSELKEPKLILQEFFSLYTEARQIKEAKAVLETLKGIERRANQKLALDLLSLKLWKTN